MLNCVPRHITACEPEGIWWLPTKWHCDSAVAVWTLRCRGEDGQHDNSHARCLPARPSSGTNAG